MKDVINWPTFTKPLFVGEVDKDKMKRINDLIDSNKIADIKGFFDFYSDKSVDVDEFIDLLEKVIVGDSKTNLELFNDNKRD